MKKIFKKWILVVLLLLGPILQGGLYWRFMDDKNFYEEYRCEECRVAFSYAKSKFSRWQLIRFARKPDVQFYCQNGTVRRKKSYPMSALSWSYEFLFCLSFFATIAFIIIIFASPFTNEMNPRANQ